MCTGSLLSFLFYGAVALTGDTVDEPKYFIEELATLDLTLKDWLNDMLATFGNNVSEINMDDIIDLIDKVLSPKMRVVAISYNTRIILGTPYWERVALFIHWV